MNDTLAQPVSPAQPLSVSSKLLLLMLAVLPACFATGFASFTYFQRTLSLLFAGLMLVLWGVESLRATRFRLASGRVLLPLGLFGLWCAVSALWSMDPLFGLLEASPLVAATVAAMVMAAPTGAYLKGHQVTGALAVGVLGTGVWGLLDAAGVHSLFNVVWNPTGPTGSFDSAEMATAFYAVALPWLAIGGGMMRGKWRALPWAALLVGGAHLALVNMQWWPLVAVASGVVGASLLFASRGMFQAKGALIGLGAGVVAIAAAALGPAALGPKPDLYNSATSLPVLETFDPGFQEDTFAYKTPRHPKFSTLRPESNDVPQVRDYLQGQWGPMAKKQPLLGLGAGGWWTHQDMPMRMEHALNQENFSFYPLYRSPHNAAVKILTEQGIVGLLLLLLSLGATFWLAITLRVTPLPEEEEEEAHPHAPPSSGWAWAAMAALISGLVMSWQSALFELAPAVILLFVALATVAQIAAQSLPASGWAQTWKTSSRPISAGLFGIVLASGMIVLGALDLTSGYFRGIADQHMIFGHYDKARDASLKSWNVLPAHPDALYNYTQASLHMGDLKSSFDLAAPLVEKRPHDARYHALRAHQYQQRREYKKAAGFATTALRLVPNAFTATSLLAVAQNRQLDFKSATATLEHMLSYKGLPDAERATIHEQAGQMYEGPMGQPIDALKHYKEAYKYSIMQNIRERLKTKADDLEKRVKRERLAREGKPIPPDLMPEMPHDEASHILGGPQGHQHGPPAGAPGQPAPPQGHEGHAH